jgi:hypothetical protein
VREDARTAFGKYLFGLRGRKTLETMADITGISRACWSRMERGMLPDVPAVIKLHKTLHQDYAQMLALCEKSVREKRREEHACAV